MKSKTKSRITGKKLLERAGLAIKHEFYLEASWILSSLFERKLSRLFEKTHQSKLKGTPGLFQLINMIKKTIPAGDLSTSSTPLSPALLDGIRNWKNQRNEILRNLTISHVSQPRMERHATEGIRLYKELNKGVKTTKKQDR